MKLLVRRNWIFCMLRAWKARTTLLPIFVRLWRSRLSSYSTIDQYFDDVLGVPVSRGYLSKLCTGIVSASLADAYEEAKAAIPDQPQLGSDETSFKDNGRKNWVWCISSAVMTVFHIATSRSRKVLEDLVGDEFKGYLNFDYFSANCSFAWNYDIKAQYCWAHLIPDIR